MHVQRRVVCTGIARFIHRSRLVAQRHLSIVLAMLERKAYALCVTAASSAYCLSLVDAINMWLIALTSSHSCGVPLVIVVPIVSLLAPKRLDDESLTLPPFGHSTFDINL